MVIFPPNPAVGDEFRTPYGALYRWDGVAWVVVGGAGGAPPVDLTPYIDRAGDAMDGDLILRGPGADPQAAVAREYVDNLASGSLYEGAWSVAANQPDIIVAPHVHGTRYVCVTPSGNPEVAPPGIPGLSGRSISEGAFILWDAPRNQWDLLQIATGGGISQDLADLRYLRLIGGAVTGPITLPGAPTAGNHAATKAYVDAAAPPAVSEGWANVTGVPAASSVQVRWTGRSLQLRGYVQGNPNVADNSAGGTLPATHRPSPAGTYYGAAPMTVGGTFAVGTVSITSTGDLRLRVPAGITPTQFRLDGVSFNVDRTTVADLPARRH